MPAPLPQPTQDETLALIAERAQLLKAGGQPPLFDVTVSRRNAAGVPQVLASFNSATLEHINNPVRWLPQLCGGGEYILNVRHPDLPDRIGGALGVSFDKTTPGMEPKAIDPRVARSPHWQGPSLVGGAYAEPQNGGAHAGATALPWGPQVTAGYGLPQSTGQPAVPVDREREMTNQLADLRAALARTEAEAKARVELENERRGSEQRVRDAENRARDAETRMQQQISQLQSAAAAPKVDPAAGWKELITVVMPLVQQMLTSQHEMRIMMMKMSEEQNRRQIDASEKQHQAQMQMIQAITAQKPGMSDEMKMLIETLKADKGSNSTDAMVAMVTKQLEAMGMMNKMSLDMINTVADINMGDSEHPVVGAIREAAMAMKTMMAGAKEGAQRIIPKKQLPAQQLTPQQIAQAQIAQRQRAAQAAAQAAAAAQAGRTTPQKPPAQPRQAVPAPQYVPPAQAQQPVAAPPAAPAAPVVMQAPDGTPQTHWAVLRAGIEAQKPAREVVDYFVSLKKADEPSLREKLDANGGSPWELLKAEFGMSYISEHMTYFEQLGETIDARGIEEGWWPNDSENELAGEEAEDELVAESSAEPLAEIIELAPAPIPLDAAPASAVPETSAVVVATPQS